MIFCSFFSFSSPPTFSRLAINVTHKSLCVRSDSDTVFIEAYRVASLDRVSFLLFPLRRCRASGVAKNRGNVCCCCGLCGVERFSTLDLLKYRVIGVVLWFSS